MTTSQPTAPTWPPTVEGKCIVVTGGSGALGTALGLALAQAGARVALVDKAPAPTTDHAGAMLHLGEVDLCDAPATRRAFHAAQAHFGRLDALVNVAGGFQWELVATGGGATWSHLFDMNLRTALNASQAILPALLGQGAGRIVNIGALAGMRADLGMGAYAASKAAVARLTEAMAEECRGRGVTVNAVLPGVIDTPANRRAMPDADRAGWLAPEALARVVMFLLSDAAAAINGALVPVTGGA